MDEKLDFSIPQKKGGGQFGNKIVLALLLILTGLGVANLLKDSGRGSSTTQPDTSGLSAGQIKQLATKLAQRNLHAQAAKVWGDYLACADITAGDRAKALFQAGTSLEQAGLYDEAIERYYRSETVAALDEPAPQIDAHIRDCFEKIGKLSALRYELMDRTGIAKSESAGGEVVAEIGAEKITSADLDALIENAIENQLSPMAAFMTVEQLNEQKKKMLDEYKSPQARRQFLQSWLAQEILYREALEDHLSGKPEIKSLLDEVTRGVLSRQLMNQQLASKINITETDLETYYAANKAEFIEPAKARISHILVKEEQQALDLIKQLKAGADFAELAKEHSADEATKNSGGKIDVDVTKGAHVPVIGDANWLNDRIFSAEAPAVLDEPVKTEKGWEIVRVDSKQAERQKSFDEVRQQVMMMLTDQKRQDVQQSYIKQMMDKYNVVIHTSVLSPSQEAPGPASVSGQQK
ncbi:MAG: peptidyl-prolyl cis-trans isomerase [Sedimentisphaerales bacterium]|nr:peptidyl-prolyl cis-trans isomerase [Sedimentisphaerales bacterium]